MIVVSMIICMVDVQAVTWDGGGGPACRVLEAQATCRSAPDLVQTLQYLTQEHALFVAHQAHWQTPRTPLHRDS